jgi:2-polyprenyl-6-methoxyphenol hydroxylase-like FAD-dependent oxidoreductase
MAGSVLIIGAGPAGAALAYLLARRGVAVTLLEKHRDFARAFRGEGLQPSGINALVQMGLGDKLAKLPQVSVKFIEIHRGGRLRTRINTEQLGFAAQFVSQPALLEMLAEESRRTSNFQLEMGVSARELLYEGERVVGVRTDTPTSTQVYHADLVIGTDGRHSITRKAGGFTELKVRQNFDVVWFKVPFPDFWPDHATVRLELGQGFVSGGFLRATASYRRVSRSPKGLFHSYAHRARRRGSTRSSSVWRPISLHTCEPVSRWSAGPSCWMYLSDD